MVFRLVVASLFVTATALAQAPGEMDEGYYGPSTVDPVAQPSCNYAAGPQRWSVGLAIGDLRTAPEGMPDQKTIYGYGELSLRYRMSPHFELELALGGGTEQIEKGDELIEGDREIHTAMLAARYRFNPQARWNWWLMAGLGSMSVASKYADERERQANERPMGQFGVGLERRFERFALHAEFRGINIGHNEEVVAVDGGPRPPEMTPTTTPDPGGAPLPPKEPTFSNAHTMGGTFTIGASYYF